MFESPNTVASPENLEELMKLDFIQPRQGEDPVAVSGVSDHERTEAGIENIHKIVRELGQDSSATIAEGTFWRVRISHENPFVLKAEQPIDEPGKKAAQRETLFQYERVKRELDREFLPTQVVLRAPDSDKLFVLQEKVNEKHGFGLSSENVEALVGGNARQDIIDSLTETRNKEKLSRFANQLQSLWDNQGLMLDLNEHNVFLDVDDKGELMITVADYGSYDKSWLEKNPRLQKKIDSRQNIIRKLKKLTKEKS